MFFISPFEGGRVVFLFSPFEGGRGDVLKRGG